MKKLWVYNPWNDIALGKNTEHFTPPPAALQQMIAGETLLLKTLSKNDFVFSHIPQQQMQLLPPTNAKVWNGESFDKIIVWGWSAAIVNELLRAGVPPKHLPHKTTLDNIRRFSHRRLSIELHHQLRSPFVPVEATTVDECLEALEKWSTVIGKYPWSSTGRGLFAGSPQFLQSFINRCKGAINHQGSVLIEKAFDVDTDFAMLFHSGPDQQVEFIGYSLFATNRRAYTHNIPLSDQQIQQLLATKVPLQTLLDARQIVSDFITRRISPLYQGYLGVDMMIYRMDNTLHLNPCVEINLRMTMGILHKLLMSSTKPPKLN
ncbi:MAG: hypothetical protein J1E99_01930 [Muribaculaceae bacterium]|nr:hypothetical protein [Muribaculaceae bacterium]